MIADFRPADGEHIPTWVECAVLGMVVTFELPQHWGLASIVRGVGTVSCQFAAASKAAHKVDQPESRGWLLRSSTFSHRYGCSGQTAAPKGDESERIWARHK